MQSDTPKDTSEIFNVKQFGWYWRNALWATDDPEYLRKIGLMLCDERDFINQEIRDRYDIIPPRLFHPHDVFPDERQAFLPLGAIPAKGDVLERPDFQ